jgi:hypothetical protein
MDLADRVVRLVHDSRADDLARAAGLREQPIAAVGAAALAGIAIDLLLRR